MDLVPVAHERPGWVAASVSDLLTIEDTSTNRRRLQGAAAILDAALPIAGVAIKRWLAAPSGHVAGRLFLPVSNRAVVSNGEAAGTG